MLAAACGDDGSAIADSDGSTSSGASTTSAATTTEAADTTVAATGSSTASADETGSSTGGGETTGGPSHACITPALPGSIAQASWDERFTIAGLTGRDGYVPSAYDIAVDTDGTLLFAGYFRWGDGGAMESIAAHDGTGWHAPMASWGELELPSAGFSAVAVGPEGQLALASYDLAMHGDGEIWVDSGAGPELVGRHAGAIRRLLWKDDELWAVGRFALEGGVASGFARWDGSTWSGAPGGDPDADVFEILDDGDGVIVAGEFTEIGGVPAAKVARFDGVAFEALDMPFAARVLALARDDEGTLHAGGVFTLAPGNPPSASLARWDGDAWSIAGGGVSAGGGTGVVSDLELVDGSLWVTGCFDQVGGDLLTDGIAVLSGEGWQTPAANSSSFGTPWYQEFVCGYEPDPDVVFLMSHQRIHHDGDQVWLAGAFPGIRDVASQSVVRHGDEDQLWHPVDVAGLGIDGSVMKLAQGGEGCDTYALVGASHVAGEPFDGSIARWTGEGWEQIAPKLGNNRYCPDFAVRGTGEILVGCGLDDGTGEIVHLVDGQWQTLAQFPETVQDLVVAGDDTVWIAGGGGGGFLAHYDEVVTSIEDGFDGLILRMAVVTEADGTPGDVIVGGGFTHVGDVAANRIARWDGSTWTPLGEGVAATPSAIAATPDGVWAGCYDEGLPGRMILGRFDGDAWTELATPDHGLAAPMGESSHTFTALRPVAEGILATGYVWPETGGRNAYLLDDDGFHDLLGGIAAISVDDVLVDDDGVWFAGSIAEVGDGETRRSSVGVARLGW